MRAATLCLVCLGAAAVLALGAPASAGPLQEGSFLLTVSVSGDGHVTSDPSGISCPKKCSEYYEDGTPVTLSANPDSGWEFAGWGGDCEGNESSCTVVMDENHSVRATFRRSRPRTTTPPSTETQTFGLTVNVIGNGSVSSSPSGISCGGDCGEDYPQGTAVTLAPLPGGGSSFVTWGGDCSGSGVCALTMDSAKSVTATFSPRREAGPEIQPKPNEGTDLTEVGDPYRIDLTFMCYSQTQLWLANVYDDVLKRVVDQGSLDFYDPKLDGGTLTRTDAALGVLRSLEYQTLLIQGFYTKFLHRLPSPTELAAALAIFAGGGHDEDIEAMLLGSTEYMNNRGGGTTDGFLNALFQDVLGRMPTTAERATFGDLSPMQAAMQLLASTEARTRLIESYFDLFLNRHATDMEVALYLGQLGSGVPDEVVAAEILGSEEYFGMDVQYEGTVDWGDGTTSPAKITRVGMTCTLSAMHTYGDQGNHMLDIEVTAPDDSKTMLDHEVMVENPKPPPAGMENVVPFGTVLIKINGEFVPLTNFTEIPFGTELDTTNGKVKLTSHDGSVGFFYEGIFFVQQAPDFPTQTAAARRVTRITLAGGNFKPCGVTKRAVSGVAKPKPKKSVRHVWGNAKGSFRTKGHYASATVRGTLWRTDDLCTGTLITVKRGKIDVFDFVKHRHFLVPAGRSYLATH